MEGILCGNTDMRSFPASWSVSVGFTFWILILALFFANHVSINKLLSLTFLIYERMVLAKVYYCFGNSVCKRFSVLKIVHSWGPTPLRLWFSRALEGAQGSLLLASNPKWTRPRVLLIPLWEPGLRSFIVMKTDEIGNWNRIEKEPEFEKQ